jgi:type IV pilus assembly protein PilY1
MKHHFEYRATARRHLLSLALVAGFAAPLPAPAALTELATSPLATSTTSTVKPNVLLLLDNSGSMDWDHMPDDASDGGSAVSFVFGYYGIRSSQCNQVYYNPLITYLPPLKADGTSYSDATYTGAWDNGFNTGSGTANLSSGFAANQSGVGGNAGDTDAGGPAYYYNYSGAQTTALQKNYNSTSNTFYAECNSALDASTGLDVFTRIQLSNTATATTALILVSGTSSTSVSGIKVNGTEEIMAGTAAASATSSTLAANIAAQINLCTSSQAGNCTTAGGHGYAATVSGSTVVISTTTTTNLDAANATLSVTRGNTGTMAFATGIAPKANAARLTNFANWYSFYRTRMLMMKTATGRAFSGLTNNYRVGLAKYSSSTPVLNLDTFESTQRSNWYSTFYGIATSGSTPTRTALSNAGKYYAGKLAVTDPIQYSCQQNFTILSTDGYWNTGDGSKLDGSTMDNQDGTAGRPMYDGAQPATTWTFTYTRDLYTKVTDNCSSGKKLKTQPQIGTCTTTSPTGSCVPTNWISNGSSTLGASCNKTSAPNPTTPVQQGSGVETAGSIGGTSNTLADVAMHYYQTDLRTPTLLNCGTPAATGPLCENNVFTSTTDNNTQQHMTTFTLGLGASGWMNYSSSYLSDTTGDYVAVKQGSTADSTATPPVCSWQANGTVCNWPFPGMDGSNNGFIANVDDLWHAAVNGRGAYFSATDPASLSSGLSNALAGINSKKGSAAAAATSTLNPVAGNNFAYVASYTTVSWKGNMEARGINTDTGVVSETASWCVENVPAGTCASPGTIVAETSGDTTIYNCVTPDVVICTDGTLVGTDCKVQVATACTGTMNALVSDTSDTRTIKTANSTGTALVDFTYANLTAAQQAYFQTAHINTLSQWSSLDIVYPGQKTALAGVNLVNFLRGQHGYENRTANTEANRLYRYREAVLGDTLESQPAFIGAPVFDYAYPAYSAFKTAQAARAGTVYIGANDGMMHAFAADTGIERWAYVPSMVMQNMWKLADTNYSTMHTNFANGSPITTDVCTANCADPATAVWKTILVAGLNGGGRGYYALDITTPGTPALLWEFTPTAGLGTVKDDDVGYSYGQAVMTRTNDGTWVVLVTSGYNNTSPGDGIGYLYVLNAGTGAIISKIATGAGSTTTPSGLAKIAGWNDEPAGNKAGYVYGGDLLGNVWRFDINGTTAAAIGTGDAMQFAILKDPSGNTQPVTTTPVLGSINGKRIIFIGTGKYLGTGDLTNTQKQTQYAIQDDDATSTLINPRTTLVPITLANNPDGSATRISTGSTSSFSGRGWYADLPDSGERVNIDSNLVQGILLVPTIVPSNTVCSPGGYGWLNYFDYSTGSATSVKFDSTIVGVNIIYVEGEPIVEVVTSTNPTPTKPSTQPGFHGSAGGFSSHRSIWRELIP